ncbi:MAG: hypothetical protein PHG02_04575, partial [Oscillospiraceae bacterium]|nr:hypothetical protein [Oscillospiraceae bacterium]
LPPDAVWCPWCGRKQMAQPNTMSARKKPRRAKNTGCIYKLSGNRAKPYAALIPGTQKLLGTFKDVASAQMALEKAINAQHTELSTLTLGQVWEEFSQSIYFNELSESAQKRHKTEWNRLKPLNATKVQAITTADFQRIIDNELAKKDDKGKALVGRSALEKTRNLASLLCKRAMSAGAMQTNNARNGVDTEIMMEMMGHEDYAVAVENYNHITDEDIERICKATHSFTKTFEASTPDNHT